MFAWTGRFFQALAVGDVFLERSVDEILLVLVLAEPQPFLDQSIYFCVGAHQA
jgi:hypothetical protein